MKKAPFVVSLVADLRPVVDKVNVLLVARRADRVRPYELPEVDLMLQAFLHAPAEDASRCLRCGGYLYADGSGEQACLNCGRALEVTKTLDQLTAEIASTLLERRRAQGYRTPPPQRRRRK